jgi:hypothetical protein
MKTVYITEQLVYMTIETPFYTADHVIFVGDIHVNAVYRNQQSSHLMGPLVASMVRITLPANTPYYTY